MSATFKIKPLDWRPGKDDCCEGFTADVPMGTYKVARYNYGDSDGWTCWKCEWSFDEYYDDGSIDVENAEKGKEAAWNDWLKRILPALEPINAEARELLANIKE